SNSSIISSRTLATRAFWPCHHSISTVLPPPSEDVPPPPPPLLPPHAASSSAAARQAIAAAAAPALFLDTIVSFRALVSAFGRTGPLIGPSSHRRRAPAAARGSGPRGPRSARRTSPRSRPESRSRTRSGQAGPPAGRGRGALRGQRARSGRRH